ncbi:putative membrane protein [Melghiribacillus thermohalophilus]|uniref:Putative membrane protein n=1 Tax=Melghiribacillus thermohalophilus TaxID=1324956 RepID=A0A4R3MS44_9BACI|nr:phage holin family protein [Melghiribacillus thermohalophilus]TCT18765.1 putative membrane protein [Melghiribacillus thermohalophilus]
MLKNWLISIVINAIAIIAVAQIFNGFIVEGFGTALLASLMLSILNVIIKPFLVILTLPITIVTLGLFLFVINAITLMIAQALIGSSFIIESFGTAILAAVIISILNLILQQLLKDTFRKK